MADVYPFRGITYNPEKSGPFDKLITQPYDKITAELQADYYKKSAYNIVRVIFSKTEPGKDPLDDSKYEKAAGYFKAWLDQGILKRNDKPCIYPYHQEYQVPATGETRVRKGFVALNTLSEHSEGKILPHEITHSGPKVDRLKLTRATGCQFGQLFMLYPDRELAVNGILDRAIAGKQPLVDVQDEYGVGHRMWLVDDMDIVKQVQHAMADKTLYVADGHHRYATAVNYWKERAESGVEPVGYESIDRAMMTFVSLDDQGLSVLPTHRVLFNLDNFSASGLLDSLRENFVTHEIGNLDESDLLKGLDHISEKRWHFVLAAKGFDQLIGLEPKAGFDPTKLIAGEGGDTWKKLEVTVLHKLILEKLLQISADDLEHQRCVEYLREPQKALSMVADKSSKYQAVFFLNPTSVHEVVDVADSGECMPQKSTDFYPKMMTGMVMNLINQ